MSAETTLMDVLADRKTAGHMTGDVKVNGFSKDPTSFARVMGYCEQFDVHSSGTTVKEAVETSAILRLSKDISAEQARPAAHALCNAA
jgi:ABC-type multidrug transport system ATPase subunit